MNLIYKGRVRTGCWQCRASKVKCDEERPTCRRCLRQNKTCMYPFAPTKSLSKSKDGNRDKVRDASSPQSSTGVNTWAPPDPLESFSDACTPNHSREHSSSDDLLSEPLSTAHRSPSLLSELISKDIHICTTVDLLAARGDQPSLHYFDKEVDHPFITPYDPINWSAFKSYVVRAASFDTAVASAAVALQTMHLTRKNSLPHTTSLTDFTNARRSFNRMIQIVSIGGSSNNFETLLVAAFLLSACQMLLPHETRPGPFDQQQPSFLGILKAWCSSDSAPTALSLRLVAWLLICHAAARRGGNPGLLSADIYDLFYTAFPPHLPLTPIESTHDDAPSSSLLSTLIEPLFEFFARLQIISTRLADLSHYHRNHTTGTDQEEVVLLMGSLKEQIHNLWQSRPMLMRQKQHRIRQEFTSLSVSEPFALLTTLCNLAYHTELVELDRNLGAEPATTLEAKDYLGQIKTLITESEFHPGFLRPLFFYAIESTHPADYAWAVAQMRRMKDPLCYSEFFANFAQGLSAMQQQKERRVTTKWYCLQTFGMPPPYL